MEAEWRRLSIEEIALKMVDAPFGSKLKTKDYIDHGIPVVQGKNLNGRISLWEDKRFVSEEKYNSLSKHHAVLNSLIFPKVGTIGKVGILTKYQNQESYLLSTNTMMLQVDPSLADRDFVYYYFSSPSIKKNIIASNSNSVQPVFNFGSLKQYPILLPPLPEQKAIASILSAIDDKIELNLQMNKTLEEMAMTLYKHWFVDFGPFKDGKFVESELGLIPEGWEVKSIKQFGKIVCGKTPSKKVQDNYTSSNGYNLIKIPDMHNKLFVIKSSDLLSEKGHSSQEKKLIPSNSINVSCIATVGLVTINAVDSHTNQQINSIIPEKEEYLYYLVNTMKNLKTRFLQEASGGSATLNMNTSTFSNIEIIKPEYKALKNYHSIVSDIYNLLKENTYNNESLISLRNTLLPKLISGKVRLKEFDKQVSEAL